MEEMRAYITQYMMIVLISSLLATPTKAERPMEMKMGSFNSRPDAHAPIGVMGDRAHHQGHWMLSYRLMKMEMKGIRSGTLDLSENDIWNRKPEYGGSNYMVAPQKMRMDMHMFSGMYAPTDNLTLMLMGSVNYKKMWNHRKMMGAKHLFQVSSKGLGDTKITALYRLYHGKNHNIQINFGLSLPTGSIDEQDYTPASSNPIKLGYAMQLGSGTWDVLPGLTYFGHTKDISWGGQITSVIRASGDNNQDYRLGNRIKLNAWGGKLLADFLSASVRLQYEAWGQIHGMNPELDQDMSPANDYTATGGRKLDFNLGVNYIFTGGAAKGNRIALEIGMPIYQNLDGPQMETDWVYTIGWQKAW